MGVQHAPCGREFHAGFRIGYGKKAGPPRIGQTPKMTKRLTLSFAVFLPFSPFFSLFLPFSHYIFFWLARPAAGPRIYDFGFWLPFRPISGLFRRGCQRRRRTASRARIFWRIICLICAGWGGLCWGRGLTEHLPFWPYSLEIWPEYACWSAVSGLGLRRRMPSFPCRCGAGCH